MRTLLEITEAVKDNESVTHEELRWATLALGALLHFEVTALRNFEQRVKQGKKIIFWPADESFRRNKQAFSRDPRSWVGESNDPASAEYQQRRRLAFAVAEKATGVKLR